VRKILSLSIGLFVLWLGGSFWAVNWVDKRVFDDLPGKIELAAARFLWTISPGINRKNDAKRALKLSWLQVSTEVHRTELDRKEEKKVQKIIGVLEKEFLFVAKYIELNHQSISSDLNSAAFIQLLTYLNRVNLFQYYFDPVLEEKLTEFGQRIDSENLTNQENWYREMMIRAHLNKDIDLYERNRNYLLSIWNNRRDIPSSFLEGVINFYDGVLLCVINKNNEAIPHLESAVKNFVPYPEEVTHFFYTDLNVLLIGKGMESGTDCTKFILNVISTGA